MDRHSRRFARKLFCIRHPHKRTLQNADFGGTKQKKEEKEKQIKEEEGGRRKPERGEEKRRVEQKLTAPHTAAPGAVMSAMDGQKALLHL
jgi:hypothetical protein